MRRATRRSGGTSLAAGMLDFRSDYSAAKQTRFRRKRTGLAPSGSSADYHYRNESQFLNVIEYARDMERNDGLIGSMLDRSVNNEVQNGFTLQSQTGDEALNDDLEARWSEWANDPEQCDAAGEMAFADMEWIANRQSKLDGDILALGREDGALQLVEAHRLRTPQRTKRNVVLGVMLDDDRRRQEYWVTRDEIDPSRALNNVRDIERFPVRDEDGFRQVFHVYNPHRASQTRGVTALAPTFDLLGMFEDANFANLLRQQISACVVFLRTRAAGTNPGPLEATGEREYEQLNDSTERLIDGIAPGLEITTKPGEAISGFSPNIPNPQFFEHMRLILTIVGNSLGLPLVLLMMDASETNFSGWRGAVDEARRGFRRNQAWQSRKFETPIYLWKLRQWIAEDRALYAQSQRLGMSFYRHIWNKPNWPYIQPLQDAQADALRLERRLISPRRLHAERGQDYRQIVTEVVEDNELMITAALEALDRIKNAHPNANVDWHELLHVSHAGPLKIAAGDTDASEAGGREVDVA